MPSLDDELTNDHPGDSQPRKAESQLESSFTFPTLALDGSVSNLRSQHRTPPAALSSLAARMASHSISNSISSLDDAYDMVDDISDMSSDDRETASIASTNNRDEEEDDDGEESGYDIDLPTGGPTAPSDGQAQPLSTSEPELIDDHQNLGLREDQAFKVRLPFHNGPALSSMDTEHMLDSTVDELETPKQSVITAKALSPLASIVDHDSKNTAATSKNQGHRSSKDTKKPASWTAAFPTALQGNFPIAIAGMTSLITTLVTGLLLSTLIWACLTSYVPSLEPPRENSTRVPELNTALQRLTDSNSSVKHVNYTHLLPEVTMIGKNVLGTPIFGTKEIRYQAIAPNHLLISLPQVGLGKFPRPVTLSVKRGQEDVPANRTQLIDGVHAITISSSDAHGIISVSMACKSPELAVSIAHDFGSRLLHLNTYEKACTDISKALAKDVAVARDAAKAVSHNLQDDIESRLRIASHQLQSTTREIAVLADKAGKTLKDVEKIGMSFADGIVKDLIAVRKEFKVKQSEAIDTIKSFVPSTNVVKDAVLLSRERALIITEKIMGLSKFSSARNNTRTKVKAFGAKLKRVRARMPTSKHHRDESLPKHPGQKVCKKGYKTSLARRVV